MSEEKSIPGAVEEGFVSVPGGKVWYRRVKGGARAPLLVLHGGPGFTHHYLTAMDDLADERDVIYYDQLGCGNSDRPGDKSLWTVERYVDELEEVRRSLGLDHCHLIGNSWGGMLGMAYAIDRQPELVSLAVSNSPGKHATVCQRESGAQSEAPRGDPRDDRVA